MCSDTRRGPNTRCAYPGCTKSVWQDSDGSYADYCGRTHRDAMASINKPPYGGLCKNCYARPVYIENGRPHDFCGMRCANENKSGGRHLAMDRQAPPVSTQCKIAGCREAAFVDKSGLTGQYCSNAHRRLAVATGKAEGCLLCMDMPKAILNGKESDFCSKRCKDDAIAAAPIILAVPPTYKDYVNVQRQFCDKWEHPNKPAPTVHKIWKIYCNKILNDDYARYRQAIERRRNIPEGNVRRRFHGTSRECRLGDDDDPRNRELCYQPDCSLCGIIRSSFEIAQAGSYTNFGRFGKGIYTSATSSKADDYVRGNNSTTRRAVLMNQVVMGKAIKHTSDDPNLTQPPQGYDSVIGEPGGVLNYDEAIVYTNDAIRPLFLIVYD